MVEAAVPVGQGLAMDSGLDDEELLEVAMQVEREDHHTNIRRLSEPAATQEMRSVDQMMYVKVGKRDYAFMQNGGDVSQVVGAVAAVAANTLISTASASISTAAHPAHAAAMQPAHKVPQQVASTEDDDEEWE